MTHEQKRHLQIKTKQEKASNLKHVCKYDYLLSSTPSRKARGHNGESATR